MSGALIFVIALVLVALVLVFAGVKTVSQGANWTIERFGRYTRTLGAWPASDRAVRRHASGARST